MKVTVYIRAADERFLREKVDLLEPERWVREQVKLALAAAKMSESRKERQ